MEVRSARNRDTTEADFCEKTLWKHYCIKSQNDRTKKMSAYLDRKQIVSVAKILQLTQKKQKASNCLEKE
jgi:hypothetical protein